MRSCHGLVHSISDDYSTGLSLNDADAKMGREMLGLRVHHFPISTFNDVAEFVRTTQPA